MARSSKKKFNYQSVIMTEVINFMGISFSMDVHMWTEVLKQLCFQSFHLFFGSCRGSVLLQSLFSSNLNRHSGVFITSHSHIILFKKNYQP